MRKSMFAAAVMKVGTELMMSVFSCGSSSTSMMKRMSACGGPTTKASVSVPVETAAPVKGKSVSTVPSEISSCAVCVPSVVGSKNISYTWADDPGWMVSGSGGPAGIENCGTRSPGPDWTVRDWTIAAVWHSLNTEKVRLALVHNTPASFSPTSPKFSDGGAITRQVDSLVPTSGTT